MSFDVFLTEDAARDLENLFHYIAIHDSSKKAAQVLNKFEQIFESLSDYPERGAYPKELVALGIRTYLEIFYKPYRVMYRVAEDAVYILLIADGRRDMQTLLQQRLFCP